MTMTCDSLRLSEATIGETPTRCPSTQTVAPAGLTLIGICWLRPLIMVAQAAGNNAPTISAGSQAERPVLRTDTQLPLLVRAIVDGHTRVNSRSLSRGGLPLHYAAVS